MSENWRLSSIREDKDHRAYLESRRAQYKKTKQGE